MFLIDQVFSAAPWLPFSLLILPLSSLNEQLLAKKALGMQRMLLQPRSCPAAGGEWKTEGCWSPSLPRSPTEQELLLAHCPFLSFSPIFG